MKMIGMWRVPGRERMMRAVCRPSMPGHAHVQQDHRALDVQQRSQRLLPRFGEHQLLSQRLEHRVQRRQALAVIVDQQDAAVMLLVIRHAANPEPG